MPPLECPLLEAFPDYPDLEGDPARMEIRVKHALTMTMGTEWNEGIPYSAPETTSGGWPTPPIGIASPSTLR